MINCGNYSTDKDFLKYLTNINIKQQLIKINILNWEEKPIAEISSAVASGNFNIDGKSSVRRTGSLNIVAQEINIDNYLSLNRKVSIYIGYRNNTKRYQEYDIFWFPLGVYVITGLSITHNLSNVSINLSLKDKMCLLNGDVGGVFTSAIQFDSYDVIDENGQQVTKRPTIFQIIRELINHWGRQPLNKIIISDLDTRVKQVMRWYGQNPLYILTKDGQYQATLNTNKVTSLIEKGWENLLGSPFEYGNDVGYIYTNFCYPGELVGDSGTTITQALDNIKNTLGNFEYFYDIEGNFVFQEIKNYLNNAENVYLKDSLENKNLLPEYLNTQKEDIYQVYAMNLNRGKSEFDFSNEKFIISYSNNPQYLEIKNDFLIWGARKNSQKQTIPIRYHLVIDKKPETGHTYVAFPYEEESLYGTTKEMIKKWHVPLEFNSIIDFPEVGVFDSYYYAKDIDSIFKWKYVKQIKDYTYVLLQPDSIKNEVYIKKVLNIPEEKNRQQNIYYIVTNENKIYRWFKDVQDEVTKKKQSFLQSNMSKLLNVDTKIHIQKVTTKDWRTELYFQGVAAEPYGLDSNDYYIELKNEWPKIYDIKPDNANGTNDSGFKEEFIKHPNTMNYYLDFIDSSFADIQSLSVENIGRRSKVLSEQELGVNCIFEPYIPDLILVPQKTSEQTELLRQECILRGQDFIQIDNSIYDCLNISGSFGVAAYNSAYENIRQLLHQFVSYNETVSIQTLPMYFLQPNIRIKLYDSDSRIYGDYIINSMSFNIDLSGSNQLNINASRALERI